ncbi:unnamed protein product [Amoebophrya sp. A120]|nr:unnamed protein product [Amoebophrya sp. A120]|eukprot:GSA120T00015753001.1
MLSALRARSPVHRAAAPPKTYPARPQQSRLHAVLSQSRKTFASDVAIPTGSRSGGTSTPATTSRGSLTTTPGTSLPLATAQPNSPAAAQNLRHADKKQENLSAAEQTKQFYLQEAIPTHVTTAGFILDEEEIKRRKNFPVRRNLLNTERPSIRQELLEDPDRLKMDDPITRQDKRLAAEFNKLNTMRFDILRRFKQETNPVFLWNFFCGSFVGLWLIYMLVCYMAKDAESFTQSFVFDLLRFWYKDDVAGFYYRLRKMAYNQRFPTMQLSASGELRQKLFSLTAEENWYGCGEEKLLEFSKILVAKDATTTPGVAPPSVVALNEEMNGFSIRDLKDRSYGAPLRHAAAKQRAREEGRRVEVEGRDEEVGFSKTTAADHLVQSGTQGREEDHAARTISATKISSGLDLHCPIQLASGLDFTGELAYPFGGCGFGMATVGPFEITTGQRGDDSGKEKNHMNPAEKFQEFLQNEFSSYPQFANSELVSPQSNTLSSSSPSRSYTQKLTLDQFANLPLFRDRIERQVHNSVRKNVLLGVHLKISSSQDNFDEVKAAVRLVREKAQYVVLELGEGVVETRNKSRAGGEEAVPGDSYSATQAALQDLLLSVETAAASDDDQTISGEHLKDRPSEHTEGQNFGVFFQVNSREELEDFWLNEEHDVVEKLLDAISEENSDGTTPSASTSFGFLIANTNTTARRTARSEETKLMVEKLFKKLHYDDPRFPACGHAKEQQAKHHSPAGTLQGSSKNPATKKNLRWAMPIIASLGGTESTTVVNAADLMESGAAIVQIRDLFIEKGVAGLVDFRSELGSFLGLRGAHCVFQLCGKKWAVAKSSSGSSNSCSADEATSNEAGTTSGDVKTKKRRKVYRPGSPQLGNAVTLGYT